jgi:hypothetical protein
MKLLATDMTHNDIQIAKNATMDAFDTLEAIKCKYPALGEEWDSIIAVQRLLVNHTIALSNLENARNGLKQ